MRKPLAILAALVGFIAAVVFAAPASAAGLGEPQSTTEQAVPISQGAKAVDAGGATFDVSVSWNYTYEDNNGNIRASVSGLTIESTSDIDDAGIDYRFRAYSGRADGSAVKIQDVTVDGADHEGDNLIVRNPKNVLNYPDVSKVVVTQVGVDGDGLAGAPKIVFKQPELGCKPTV